MAKNPASPKNPSRIRLVVFEAELGDGDISQITHAITNALRAPTHAAMPKRISSTTQVINASDPVEPEVVEDGGNEEDIVDVAPSAPRVQRPRKIPRTPDVILTIDMNADVSLASFAEGKDASSQHKKYLICAAWLKEHRSIDAVTASHIYTCFRSMGWSVNIPDFTQVLRELKSKRYLTKGGRGEYEINHLGLDFVKKLGSDGTS